MPTYVYETIPEDASAQPRRFEVEQRMSDAPLSHDPDTGLPVRRVITGGIGLIGAGVDAGAPACETGMCDPGIPSPCCAGGMCGLN